MVTEIFKNSNCFQCVHANKRKKKSDFFWLATKKKTLKMNIRYW